MSSYLHDPIDEAMCEFTFAPASPSAQWDLTLPGRIQQHERLSKVYVGPSRQQTAQQITAGLVDAPNASPNVAISTVLLRVLLPFQRRGRRELFLVGDASDPVREVRVAPWR